jgi:hypothetical protein
MKDLLKTIGLAFAFLILLALVMILNHPDVTSQLAPTTGRGTF